jgi:hypothetical protein
VHYGNNDESQWLYWWGFPIGKSIFGLAHSETDTLLLQNDWHLLKTEFPILVHKALVSCTGDIILCEQVISKGWGSASIYALANTAQQNPLSGTYLLDLSLHHPYLTLLSLREIPGKTFPDPTTVPEPRPWSPFRVATKVFSSWPLVRYMFHPSHSHHSIKLRIFWEVNILQSTTFYSFVHVCCFLCFGPISHLSILYQHKLFLQRDKFGFHISIQHAQNLISYYLPPMLLLFPGIYHPSLRIHYILKIIILSKNVVIRHAHTNQPSH